MSWQEGKKNLWQMTPVVFLWVQTTPCCIICFFLPRCSRDGKSRAFHLKNPMLIFMKFRGEQLLLKSQEGQWLLFFCDGRYFPFFMTLHTALKWMWVQLLFLALILFFFWSLYDRASLVSCGMQQQQQATVFLDAWKMQMSAAITSTRKSMKNDCHF